MKELFMRRLFAYILDFLALSCFLVIPLMFLPMNEKKLVEVQNNLVETTDSYLRQDINENEFFENYGKYIYDLDKLQIPQNIANSLLIIILFTIVPFYQNGQTFGKKVMKIRVVALDGTNATMNQLIVRSLIIHFLGYALVALGLIFILNQNYYFLVATFFNLCEYLLVIISIFMLLYRRDQRGLHDIITKTKVVQI